MENQVDGESGGLYLNIYEESLEQGRHCRRCLLHPSHKNISKIAVRQYSFNFACTVDSYLLIPVAEEHALLGPD